MRIVILWDVFGRTGRRMVEQYLPGIRAKYQPDFLVANSENITSGKGPSMKHIREMEALGFDVLTGWNHVFSHLQDIGEYINTPDSIQIRPANYFDAPGYQVPGKGYRIVERDGKKLLVLNIMSSVFMRDNLDNPFLAVDRILNSLGESNFDAILVDFHRETTAESSNMTYFLDGRVSVVYGTHTHVQTNDEQIFPGGTGMITDVGMTGPLRSSIGQTFESRLPQFLTGTALFGPRAEQVVGEGLLSGLYVEIENRKCVKIEKIRIREE